MMNKNELMPHRRYARIDPNRWQKKHERRLAALSIPPEPLPVRPPLPPAPHSNKGAVEATRRAHRRRWLEREHKRMGELLKLARRYFNSTPREAEQILPDLLARLFPKRGSE